ncbi:MAG TPA: glycosyltransferase [Bacillota bacterium]|nr:glycosyltransferase [Bacillota bacterium]
MKKVSIVIPTKDKLSRLQLVLKALEPQVDHSIEVIVVFDGCSRETLEEFAKLSFCYKPVTIVFEKNQGRARARNAGIQAATGQIVIFLDDDRLPSSSFVRQHLKCHENGRYAVIGRRNDWDCSEAYLAQLIQKGITPEDFTQIEKISRPESSAFLKKIGRRVFGQLLECITFTTGNSSVSRKDLIQIGMFDPGFKGWGVEDMDLGYRLIRSGVKVIRDYSIVNYHLVHPVDPSNQKEEYWRNLNYFLEKIKEDKLAVFVARLLSMIMYR